jgi:hypothetical protein
MGLRRQSTFDLPSLRLRPVMLIVSLTGMLTLVALLA